VLLAEAVELADKSDPVAAKLPAYLDRNEVVRCRGARGLCGHRAVGALAAVEERIDLLTRRALDALSAAPINVQAKVGLAELARLAANRSA